MRISGSTMGTISLAWHNAAYRARAWALVLMQYPLGLSSVILMTARHLANRAPI